MIGSLFNSHLFDFTHGWTYVLGVGIAGGTVLKDLSSRQIPVQKDNGKRFTTRKSTWSDSAAVS